MTLPGCERCGATGWVITLMAPVYVSVDADGSVRRVRVNDEAVSVWDTGCAAGRPRRDMPALVTCDGDDHEAPADVARAVILAADACASWPGWELGA